MINLDSNKAEDFVINPNANQPSNGVDQPDLPNPPPPPPPPFHTANWMLAMVHCLAGCVSPNLWAQLQAEAAVYVHDLNITKAINDNYAAQIQTILNANPNGLNTDQQGQITQLQTKSGTQVGIAQSNAQTEQSEESTDENNLGQFNTSIASPLEQMMSFTANLEAQKI
ncbi:MAG TPA: hypothetical protein VGJ00_05025 [Rhabdochlamydiaceae bacterium]